MNKVNIFGKARRKMYSYQDVRNSVDLSRLVVFHCFLFINSFSIFISEFLKLLYPYVEMY